MKQPQLPPAATLPAQVQPCLWSRAYGSAKKIRLRVGKQIGWESCSPSKVPGMIHKIMIFLVTKSCIKALDIPYLAQLMELGNVGQW